MRITRYSTTSSKANNNKFCSSNIIRHVKRVGKQPYQFVTQRCFPQRNHMKMEKYSQLTSKIPFETIMNIFMTLSDAGYAVLTFIHSYYTAFNDEMHLLLGPVDTDVHTYYKRLFQFCHKFSRFLLLLKTIDIKSDDVAIG